ncbi:cullin-1-like isoform X2 [Neltuma alba]|nr:cullin-1-like isoform X2 [Prosopis alba]
MFYYTIVYELCTDRQGEKNSKMLYDQYKKVFDEYINSTVLPSLRVKEDEDLLVGLLRRWSNHKIMTWWLSRFFNYLNRYYIPRWGLPSLEESSLLSFHDLVYGEMNKQIVGAVLYMTDREHAGEHIDRALLNNVLAIYTEIGDISRKYHAKGFEEMLKGSTTFYFDGASSWMANNFFKDPKPKEEKLDDHPIKSTKQVYLTSSDGDIFVVNYDVALMLESIKDMVESEATSTANSTIPLKLSSKILIKVIQYCYKHVESSNFEGKTSGVDLKDWDVKFVEVNNATLFDLILASNYLNIKSLLDLASQKVGDMMKGKTPEEIRKMFNIKDEFEPKEDEEFLKENR